MEPAEPITGSLSGCFTFIDWLVVIGYFVLISYLGIRLAGKQTSMEDFFRGGNKLPWYAVAGSMIATIVSAVTFVAVPTLTFSDGGNFSYMQFGIISGFLSRAFVAFVLVPAYYRYHVFSPYDYMGKRLGVAARSVTTVMFSLLGLLAQAVRVYLTAMILELVLRDFLISIGISAGFGSLIVSIALVGIIAVAWTMAGGIATVIWTDAMLFLVFVAGGLLAIGLIAAEVPGGIQEVVRQGWDAGKFKLFTLSSGEESNFASSWGAVFAYPFTFWAAVFAVTFGNIGSYGTDQLLAQRIFTCRNQREAKLAVMASWAAELVAALMLLVGVGLWVFYQQFPERLTGEALAAVEAKKDNIFPVFILTQVPVVIRGLIVAGIFAAAVSSLTSILAALAQTSLSAAYLPWRKIDPDGPLTGEQNRNILWMSRLLIVLWALALCAMAVAMHAYVDYQKAHQRETLFLELALGMANYVVGTLLAAFLLAWLPHGKDAYGLIWAAPLSVFCVLASRFHEPWTWLLCWAVSGVLVFTWILAAMYSERTRPRLWKTPWLLLGCAIMLLITHQLWFAKIDPETGEWLRDAAGQVVKAPIAWPWYAPLGGAMAFLFGYLLAEPRSTGQTLDVPSNADTL